MQALQPPKQVSPKALGPQHTLTKPSPKTKLEANLWLPQVLRQPHGKFTAGEHSVRVLPVLVAPLAAYLLHSVLRWGVGVLGRRDAARMKMLEAKLRKMVAELKVWHGGDVAVVLGGLIFD